jgi:hypothetical protein
VIARDTATADEPAAITLALRRHPDEKLAIFRLQSSNAEFSAPIPAQLSFPVTLKDFRRFVESWNNLEYLGVISKNPPLPTGGSEPPVVPASDHWKREQMARPTALSAQRANLPRSCPFECTLSREVTSAHSKN